MLSQRKSDMKTAAVEDLLGADVFSEACLDVLSPSAVHRDAIKSGLRGFRSTPGKGPRCHDSRRLFPRLQHLLGKERGWGLLTLVPDTNFAEATSNGSCQ